MKNLSILLFFILYPVLIFSQENLIFSQENVIIERRDGRLDTLIVTYRCDSIVNERAVTAMYKGSNAFYSHQQLSSGFPEIYYWIERVDSCGEKIKLPILTMMINKNLLSLPSEMLKFRNYEK